MNVIAATSYIPAGSECQRACFDCTRRRRKPVRHSLSWFANRSRRPPTTVGIATDQARMFTARAATSAIVKSEMADSIIISILARRDNGIVSVGEKAVALVNDR